MRIDDGTGKGYQAGVNEENHLQTVAITVPQQHRASITKGNAFQVSGSYTLAGAGTYTLLTIVNASGTDVAVGTYIRSSVAGLTGGTIGTGTYVTLNFGGTYSAGGTAVTPVNMNRVSGNSAPLTAYSNNPTVTGTLTEFDRWYPTAVTDHVTYNKEGTMILGTNDSVTFQLVTDNTGGLARIRMSFFLLASSTSI
jgi:hypothetical protein